MSWKDKFSRENRYFEIDNGILYCNDVIEQLLQFPDESIDCVITSPPYWALRDYGVDGQIGLEPTFQEYLEKLWEIFDEIYRILKPTGTCWVNLGDCYFTKIKGTGGKSKKQESNKGSRFTPVRCRMEYREKCLCMVPERFAIGMIERGWILRNQIIWHKPNAMPQSVKDRFTVDFEKIFFFTKNKKYYFNQLLEPVKTHENRPYGIVRNRIYGYNSKLNKLVNRTAKNGQRNGQLAKSARFGDNPKGRNKRTVWSINTKPFKEAHFAVFPPEISEICIQAGCPEDGIVLDPFFGAGTVGVVAEKLNRKWIGIEINPEYCEIAKQRILTLKQKEV